jgi:hypothetical protein
MVSWALVEPGAGLVWPAAKRRAVPPERVLAKPAIARDAKVDLAGQVNKLVL